jgi:hypothetical protein
MPPNAARSGKEGKMRRHLILSVLALSLAVGGCAWVSQQRQDYAAGRAAVAAGEAPDPTVHAKSVIEQVKPFLPAPLQPVAGGLAGVIGAVGFITIGRKRRLGQPTSDKNALGWIGNVGFKGINLESLLQIAADLRAGLMEWGSDGSPVKRFVKIGVSVALAVIAAAFMVPGFAQALAGNEVLVTTVGGLAALIGALDKKLGEIKVVKPTTPTPGA